jgi:hypothetical protein
MCARTTGGGAEEKRETANGKRQRVRRGGANGKRQYFGRRKVANKFETSAAFSRFTFHVCRFTIHD